MRALMNWIARWMFPGLSPTRRQREFRRFSLAVGLGLVLALIIGVILYLLNVQHRI